MKDEAYVKEILQKFGETIDYYSQELRDKKIKKDLRTVYNEAYGDFYRIEASKWFGIPVEDITDEQRETVKTVMYNKMWNIHSCFETDCVPEHPTLLDLGIIGGLDRNGMPIKSAAETLRDENRAKELTPKFHESSRNTGKTFDFALINDIPVGFRKIGGRGLQHEIN